MVRKSNGVQLQKLVREMLVAHFSSSNLEVYPKEYCYNYRKFIPKLRRNPSCDIAISDNENLFLIEIESQGTPSWNALKVWHYIKHGGCFNEWKEPKRVYILHFASKRIRKYDISIAKDLIKEIRKTARKKGMHLKYEGLLRFDSSQKEREDIAKKLSNRIIKKIKEKITPSF
jgi:hypothetical protein